MTTHHPQPKILVVDDDAGNVELLASIFEDDCEVLFATDGERAIELARDTLPDAILLDVMMPGMDGFEVCRRLKAARRTSSIPVVFVTGIGDLDSEARGLQLGAADYVNKPINPPVVRLRVLNQIELKQARDRLTHLATTDGLTGIANRRHLEEVLSREYDQHAASQAPLSVVILDIDHFKAYNDTYGHLQGDDCLCMVARAVDRCVGVTGDLAARYGGEEFVCVLRESDAQAAAQMGEHIRQAVVRLAIEHRDSSAAPHVTVSVGTFTLRCTPGGSANDALSQADAALYRAKQAGRNQVCSAPANGPPAP